MISMGGNQKSSKIDSLKDQYGRVVYNRHELYDMIYDGIDVSDIKTVDWNEDFDKFKTEYYIMLERLVFATFDYKTNMHLFPPNKATQIIHPRVLLLNPYGRNL